MAEQVQGFCMDSIRELGKGAWRGLGVKDRCVSNWAGGGDKQRACM